MVLDELLAFLRRHRQSLQPMRLTIVQVDLTESVPEIDVDVGFDEIAEPPRSLEPRRLPPNRSVCVDGPRPCPYVSCRHHLYLDVRGDGKMRLNFPDRSPEEMLASCALDMAEDGPRTLDSIAALMGMSKERARQLESSGFQKIKDLLGEEHIR